MAIYLALGAILEALFIIVGYGLSTSTDDIVPFVLLCLAAFAVYALALAAAPRRGSAALIFCFGVLFRATLIPVKGDAYLPDSDAYRYLWDGGVTAAGMNPYRYSPEEIDRAVDGTESYVRLATTPPYDRIFPEINHREVPTIYPPLSQYVFAAAGGSFIVLKLVLALFDVGTMLLLLPMVRSPRRLLIYAWCPLVVEEFAYAGHHDSIAVFFVTLSVFLLLRGRNVLSTRAHKLLTGSPNPIPANRPTSGREPAASVPASPGHPARNLCARVLSGGAMGLAISAKLFPAVLLPLLLRRAGWRGLAAAVGTAAVLAIPFLGAGWGIFSGLGAFAERWKANAGAFAVLEAAAGPAARWIAAAAVVSVSLWFLLREGDPLRQMLVVLSVMLLLSPVLDPWYVTWIVPLLCLRPFWPLILLTGCVFLHYLYFMEFRDPGWIRPLEYGIFYLALLVEGVRHVRARAADAARPAAGE